MPEEPNPQPITLRPDNRLSAGAQAWLDDHLSRIKERIIDEALTRTSPSASGAPTIVDPMTITDAARQFAPGDHMPVESRRAPLVYRILEPLSGLTLVCAVLAVVFGCLGLWAPDPKNAQSWLDIAKVFAGAVVGSAGATVASSRSK